MSESNYKVISRWVVIISWRMFISGHSDMMISLLQISFAINDYGLLLFTEPSHNE